MSEKIQPWTPEDWEWAEQYGPGTPCRCANCTSEGAYELKHGTLPDDCKYKRREPEVKFTSDATAARVDLSKWDDGAVLVLSLVDDKETELLRVTIANTGTADDWASLVGMFLAGARLMRANHWHPRVDDPQVMSCGVVSRDHR